jgi:transcriptional regulator with XRE-family HTH domain
LKQEVAAGIKFHLEGLREDGDPVPEPFDTDFLLVFKWDVESLLYYYKGIITPASLARLTGINQKQLSHYANGVSKPREPAIKKIEEALHHLGEELTAISL